MVSFIIRFVMSLVYKGIRSPLALSGAQQQRRRNKDKGFWVFRVTWITAKMLLSHVPAAARIWIAAQVQKVNHWTGNTSGKINFVPEQPGSLRHWCRWGQVINSHNQPSVLTLSDCLLHCKHSFSFPWTYSLNIWGDGGGLFAQSCNYCILIMCQFEQRFFVFASSKQVLKVFQQRLLQLSVLSVLVYLHFKCPEQLWQKI